MSEATLELSRSNSRSREERVVAQMTLTAGGQTLRGQERAVNVHAAIDAVTDLLDRQIRRHKGKSYRSEQAKRSGAAGSVRPIDGQADLPGSAEDEEQPVSPGRVVRTKRFAMAPMAVEDALHQIEMLSHDFFLFFNIESNQYSVLYRRRDGDFGLIEPYLD